LHSTISLKNETYYYRHWVRESLLKPVTQNWQSTNPPQYEVINYRGKWTVHFLTEFRPILIAEEKNKDIAIQRMCEHADQRALTLRLEGKVKQGKSAMSA
jgi:hypothetical protein